MSVGKRPIFKRAARAKNNTFQGQYFPLNFFYFWSQKNFFQFKRINKGKDFKFRHINISQSGCHTNHQEFLLIRLIKFSNSKLRDLEKNWSTVLPGCGSNLLPALHYISPQTGNITHDLATLSKKNGIKLFSSNREFMLPFYYLQ